MTTPASPQPGNRDERTTGWLAATCYPVGSLENYSWSYSWDGNLHATRRAAIKAGREACGSDDFNVGQVKDGALVWWGWMSEEHAEDLAAAAAGLGLPLAAERAAEALEDAANYFASSPAWPGVRDLRTRAASLRAASRGETGR